MVAWGLSDSLCFSSSASSRQKLLGSFFAGGGESSVQTDRPTTGPTSERFAGEDRDVKLVSFVLDDAQKTWTQIFEEHGRQYRHAKLVLYRE